MNKSKYDSLPEDIKKLMIQLREERLVPEVKAMSSYEDETLEVIKKEAPNIKYFILSDKTMASWKEKGKLDQIIEEAIKRREASSPTVRDFWSKYVPLVNKYKPEMRAYYKDPMVKANGQIID